MTEALMTENSDTEGANAPETGNDIDFQIEQNSNNQSFSKVEQAYFASRGETELASDDEALNENGKDAAALSAQHKGEEDEASSQKASTITAQELQKMRNKALDWQREFASLHYPQQQQMTEQATTPPDPRQDFLGFARWQGQEINRLEQQIAAQQNQASEEERQKTTENAIMAEWDEAVAKTRQTTPDIDEALHYLEDARLRQLGVLGQLDARFSNQQFCQQQVMGELRDIVISTFQQGKNPAAAVYEIAKAYGFGRDDTARMQKLQQATTGARSLTAGTGKQAGDPYLLETVANMPEAEFATWYEHNKASFRSMFGG